MKKLTFDGLRLVAGGERVLKTPDDFLPAFNAYESSGGSLCQTHYSLCLNGYE